MSIEHPTAHAAEGDGLLADRLRAIPGLVRKAPASADTAKPATSADPFGRSAFKPRAGFVEVAAPAGTRTEPGAPRTRHFRVLEPKMQHRADGRVLRRPTPAT